MIGGELGSSNEASTGAPAAELPGMFGWPAAAGAGALPLSTALRPAQAAELSPSTTLSATPNKLRIATEERYSVARPPQVPAAARGSAIREGRGKNWLACQPTLQRVGLAQRDVQRGSQLEQLRGQACFGDGSTEP